MTMKKNLTVDQCHRGRKVWTTELRLDQLLRQCSGVGDPDVCWVWQGSRTTARVQYGKITVDGRTVSAHRQSWVLHNGNIPSGLVVRHTCHNSLCCNPSHMALGTTKDNERDKILAGRKNPQRGELNARHKLTEEDVQAIRHEYASGTATHRSLAAKYGVSYSLIRGIVTGRRWAYARS